MTLASLLKAIVPAISGAAVAMGVERAWRWRKDKAAQSPPDGGIA